MRIKPPRTVLWLTDAVSRRLGRPAQVRNVRNSDDWYVSDPVFSFVQHGMKKGQTGYRVGFCISVKQRNLRFVLIHSPLIAKLFRRNLDLVTLIGVTRDTAKNRNRHQLYWSSKSARNRGKNAETIDFASLAEFESKLRQFDEMHGFVRDLFARRPNTGKGGGSAPVAGNDFSLLLSNKPSNLASMEAMDQIIGASWPLFLCLYPIRAIEGRSASLARNLRSRQIIQKCEFESVVVPRESRISRKCSGVIHGAHIKPDTFGGSDKAENGLWLCEYHHRATEGKLHGRRSELGIHVGFGNGLNRVQ